MLFTHEGRLTTGLERPNNRGRLEQVLGNRGESEEHPNWSAQTTAAGSSKYWQIGGNRWRREGLEATDGKEEKRLKFALKRLSQDAVVDGPLGEWPLESRGHALPGQSICLGCLIQGGSRLFND